MKVYVVAEALSTSGGPETLHQLAEKIKQMRYDTYLYYIDSPQSDIPEKFFKYEVQICRYIEDESCNVLIVPESFTYFLAHFKKIKKSIIWLSLDFYLGTLPHVHVALSCRNHKVSLLFYPAILIVLLLKKRLKFNVYRINKDDDVFHMYNCEYVKSYLLSKGVRPSHMSYVCGPLSDIYFQQEVDLRKKENIVLYNPKKGMKFTHKLIAFCKEKKMDFQFIPIRNMKPNEIVELMKKAKLYIDFGFFPGPERIPRESVMMMCNIVTSNKGSASNEYDVPIPSKYKFNASVKQLGNITKTMLELVKNYENHIKEYDMYRDKVLSQKNDFEMNIRDAIKKVIR